MLRDSRIAILKPTLNTPLQKLFHVLCVLGKVAFLAAKCDVSGLISPSLRNWRHVIDMPGVVKWNIAIGAPISEHSSNFRNVEIGIAIAAGTDLSLPTNSGTLRHAIFISSAIRSNMGSHTRTALKPKTTAWGIPEIVPS